MQNVSQHICVAKIQMLSCALSHFELLLAKVSLSNGFNCGTFIVAGDMQNNTVSGIQSIDPELFGELLLGGFGMDLFETKRRSIGIYFFGISFLERM